MSFRARFALWLLRRFKAFRKLEAELREAEHRLQFFRLDASLGREFEAKGSVRAVERDLGRHMMTWCPVWLHIEVLPTVQDVDLGPGQIQVQIIEGGNAHV